MKLEERRQLEKSERRERGEHERRGHEGEHEGEHGVAKGLMKGDTWRVEAHGEMEIDISGWHGLDRQDKKDAKRRAKQRKAESREKQQQVETSIGEEAVPELAGKAAGRWRGVRRTAALFWRLHMLEHEAAEREHSANYIFNQAGRAGAAALN